MFIFLAKSFLVILRRVFMHRIIKFMCVVESEEELVTQKMIFHILLYFNSEEREREESMREVAKLWCLCEINNLKVKAAGLVRVV